MGRKWNILFEKELDELIKVEEKGFLKSISKLVMGFPYPYPLGLPKGSVRATITLAITVTLLVLTTQESEFAESISVSAAVAITFYFGGRMRGSAVTPRESIAADRAWGLPAGSIRSILFTLYGGMAVYLYYSGDDIPEYLIEILNIIVGYIIGHNFNKIRRKLFPKKEDSGVSWFDHFKAFVVLTLTGLTVYFITSGTIAQTELWILIFNVTVGFYFGERS